MHTPRGYLADIYRQREAGSPNTGHCVPVLSLVWFSVWKVTLFLNMNHFGKPAHNLQLSFAAFLFFLPLQRNIVTTVFFTSGLYIRTMW